MTEIGSHDQYTYLQFDSVELIKASPRPGTSETFEELPHGKVVQSVRAVEDDALSRQSLRQVFHSLSFPGPRGPLGGTPQVQVEGPHEGSVAAVSEGGYNQSVGATHSQTKHTVTLAAHAHRGLIMHT